jgi:hypothetical protein
VHSDLSCSDKERILDLPPDERIVAAREILPLSEFPAYIEGRRNFSSCIWGNFLAQGIEREVFSIITHEHPAVGVPFPDSTEGF